MCKDKVLVNQLERQKFGAWEIEKEGDECQR